jgi:hypothetical protein
MSSAKSWFIQALLFAVYFLVSYNLALPNVVLSVIIALLLVNSFTNANRIRALEDGVFKALNLNDQLHHEKVDAIRDLNSRVEELESKSDDLDSRVLDLEVPNTFDEYNYEE